MDTAKSQKAKSKDWRDDVCDAKTSPEEGEAER